MKTAEQDVYAMRDSTTDQPGKTHKHHVAGKPPLAPAGHKEDPAGMAQRPTQQEKAAGPAATPAYMRLCLAMACLMLLERFVPAVAARPWLLGLSATARLVLAQLAVLGWRGEDTAFRQGVVRLYHSTVPAMLRKQLKSMAHATVKCLPLPHGQLELPELTAENCVWLRLPQKVLWCAWVAVLLATWLLAGVRQSADPAQARVMLGALPTKLAGAIPHLPSVYVSLFVDPQMFPVIVAACVVDVLLAAWCTLYVACIPFWYLLWFVRYAWREGLVEVACDAGLVIFGGCHMAARGAGAVLNVFKPCLWHPARLVHWLLKTSPTAWRVLLRSLASVPTVLWAVVAGLLTSLPWQPAGFALLDPDLAYVLPFAELFLAYPHTWVYCRHHLSLRALPRVWVWRVCRLQHAVFLGLLYNWFKLSEEAFVLGTVTAASCASLGVGCAGLARGRILAHLVLSCVYSVLPAVVSAAASSRAARKRASKIVAQSAQFSRAISHKLRLMRTSCRRAGRTASQAVVGTLCAGVNSCGACVARMCLASPAARLVSMVVHAPAQLGAAFVGLEFRGAYQRLVRRVGSTSVAAVSRLANQAQTAQAGRGQDSGPSRRAAAGGAVAAGACGHVQQGGAGAPMGPKATPTKQHVRACVVPDVDCVVCLDARRSVALFPCNHVVLCDACFVDLQAQAERAGAPPCCPVCRREVLHHAQGLILS